MRLRLRLLLSSSVGCFSSLTEPSFDHQLDDADTLVKDTVFGDVETNLSLAESDPVSYLHWI